MTDNDLHHIARQLFGPKPDKQTPDTTEKDPLRQFVADLFNQADND